MTLDERINKAQKKFTKTEKIFLQYLLENKQNIAFLSIHDLSDNLKMGKASIQRFANKLGLKGFAELKKEIIQEIKVEISPLEKFKTILDDKSIKHFTINQVAEDEVTNINTLLNNFDEKSFNDAVERIIQADIIYVAGIGVSHHLAGLTAYFLQRIGYKAFQLNFSSLSFTEQIINIKNTDLLITYSFPPYSPGTIQAAEFAKKQGAKVLTITNSLNAPVLGFTDTHFLVKTDNRSFTNSITPMIVLLYTLLDEVATKNKKRSAKAIKTLIKNR